MRTLNKIIIHCSDSDYAHHDNIEAIRHWHVKERGWRDIGYQFVVTKDGKWHHGRPIQQAGAHCRGQNSDSIGICVTGKNDFSEEQINSLIEGVDDLLMWFGLGWDAVYPHKHFDPGKTCPNFDIKEEVLKG